MWLFVSLTLAVTALRSNKRWHALLVTHDISRAMAGKTTTSRLLHRTSTLAARCACLHFRHRPRPYGSLRLSAFSSEIETPPPHNHTGGQVRLPTFYDFRHRPRPCGFSGKVSFWARSRLLHAQPHWRPGAPACILGTGPGHLVLSGWVPFWRGTSTWWPGGAAAGPGPLRSPQGSSSLRWIIRRCRWWMWASISSSWWPQWRSSERWPHLVALAASTQQSPLPQQSMDSSLLSIKM